MIRCASKTFRTAITCAFSSSYGIPGTSLQKTSPDGQPGGRAQGDSQVCSTAEALILKRLTMTAG